MVDFNKIREQNRHKAIELAAKAIKDTPTAKWGYWERFQHLISHHLAAMTTWEEEFCYSTIAYISEVKSQRIAQGRDAEPDWDMIISARTRFKLKEIEDTYCGQMCHALQETGTVGIKK